MPAIVANPENICGAKRSRGGICKAHAGMGTDHYGTGRCKTHDGPRLSYMIEYLKSCLDPILRDRVEILLEDPDMLNCRGELAVLKARFAQIAFVPEDECNFPLIIKMTNAIINNAKKIHEMEVGKQHYIHISVTGAIIAAFADIGRRYITDPDVQHQFESDVVDVIRKELRSGTARAIAAKALVPKMVEMDRGAGELVIPVESEVVEKN